LRSSEGAEQQCVDVVGLGLEEPAGDFDGFIVVRRAQLARGEFEAGRNEPFGVLRGLAEGPQRHARLADSHERHPVEVIGLSVVRMPF